MTVGDTDSQNAWLVRFRQAHGSEFNPASRVDREKMAALKGDIGIPITGQSGAKGISRVQPGKIPSRLSGNPAPQIAGTSIGIPIDRQAILNVGCKLVGTTERTGNNDGPVIEAIQRAAGIRAPGDPYCAAFNFWCYREAGAASIVPRSGWSPDWVKAPTWTAAKGGKTPQPGDSFGIYFPSKGRVAHTGLVEEWGEVSTTTIEGNTSPAAAVGSASDRNGDGIWRKRRLTRQIHSVRNWIGP